MQQYLSIDYLIIYAFFLGTLWLGIRAGRGVKDVREYVVANKSFGVGALVLTYLATNLMGASVFAGIIDIFLDGTLAYISLFGLIPCFLIRAFYIAPKAAHFSDSLTMGDLMGTFYDRNSKIIAGVLGFLTSISIAGMELVLLGVIGEKILNFPATWTIIIGGIILAMYSAHGGIKSVTITDVFQFIVFIIGLPALAYFILNKAGGIQTVLHNIPNTHLQITEHSEFSLYVTLFLLYSFFPAGMIDPAIIQRLLMGAKPQDLRNKYLVIAGFDPAFQLMIFFIACSALVLFPDMDSQAVVPHIFSNLLPAGLKGVAITGLLAINVSSIDSYLHVSGVTLVHDVIQPLLGEKKSKINELRWMKYATVGVSFIAIAITLYTNDIFGLFLNSLAFTAPLLMFPLLSGIMGLKTDTKSFYVAMVITLVAFVGCKLLLPEDISYLMTLITIIVNGITFFGMHFYINTGFAVVNRKNGEDIVYKPTRKKFTQALRELIPTPRAIMRYSERKVQAYGSSYNLFGIFFTINFIVPYFIFPTDILPFHGSIFLFRMVGGILCALLIVTEKWDAVLQPYLPVFWHFAVMYCLPFMGMLTLLFSGGRIEWVMHIMATIILLFLLLDWGTAIITCGLGVVLGYVVYRVFFGIPVLDLSFSNQYLIIYQVVFGLLIGIIFARRKQLRYNQLDAERKEAEEKEQSNLAAYEKAYQERLAVIQELRNGHIDDMPDVMRGIQTLKAQIQGKDPLDRDELTRLIKDVDKKLTPISFSIVALDHRALNYLRLPEIGPIEMRTLLEDLQSQFPHQRIQYLGNTKKQTITCGIPQLKTVMHNMTQILSSSVTKTVCIAIEDTILEYPAPNVKYQHVKRIPAFRFAFTDDPTSIKPVDYTYYVNMRSSVIPAADGKTSMMLATNHRIVRAHYGYTNVDISQTKDYKYYAYVFPEDLEEVRPKDMNSPAMELGAALVRANDEYPGAKKQEEEFLRELASKTTVNMENVVETLELIKWYHGSVMRRSGEPFYLHPLAVARIVLDWTTDEDVIIGALLHDTVEDTRMLLEQVDMKFGPVVRNIVDCVTHFESYQASFYKLKLSEHENISMLLEKADRRALLVKVADRMHNMRTIDGHKSEEKKRKIAEDTLKFYVPLSLTLNLPQIDIDELRLRSEKVLEWR